MDPATCSGVLLSLIILHSCCLARLTTWQLQELIEVGAGEVIFTLQCHMEASVREHNARSIRHTAVTGVYYAHNFTFAYAETGAEETSCTST